MSIANVAEYPAGMGWDEENNGFPEWKREFVNYQNELMPGLGFSEITMYHDGVTHTWKRMQGALVMTVTMPVQNKHRSTIWCSWNYIDADVPPSGCALNERLWRAIRDGFENHALLTRFFEEEE